jgi:hypothetical protein
MHFERTIDIDAPADRVWAVVSDVAAWPSVVDTVERIELLTPPPLTVGSRVRIRQPKLPEGDWLVSAWEAPSFFEWIQRSGGMTVVASHRVEGLGQGRARLTLTIDMRGLLAPVMGRVYRNLTDDYLCRETEGIRRASESA